MQTKINRIPLVLFAVLMVGLFSCSSSIDDRKAKNVKANAVQPVDAKKLPGLIMTDASGNSTNLSSFKGKKIFVNLWATWCPPCKAEIPSIEALASKVDTAHAVFVLLSLDKNFEVAKKFAKSENLSVPIYYPAEKLPALFNIDGIPATFIFNEDGILEMQNNGADDYDTEEYLHILSGE